VIVLGWLALAASIALIARDSYRVDMWVPSVAVPVLIAVSVGPRLNHNLRLKYGEDW
jgi:hypothetical protein